MKLGTDSGVRNAKARDSATCPRPRRRFSARSSLANVRRRWLRESARRQPACAHPVCRTQVL